MRLMRVQPLPEVGGAIAEYRLEDNRALRLMRFKDDYVVGVETYEATVEAVGRNSVLTGFAAAHGMQITAHKPEGSQAVESVKAISWKMHVTSIDFESAQLFMRWRRADELYDQATLSLVSSSCEMLPDAMHQLEALADPIVIGQALGALAIQQP